MSSTKIEWAEKVWNPVVGCSQVSNGCRNCYAERMANRLAAMKYKSYQQVISCGVWNGKTAFRESEPEKPLHWKKPRRVFVCSMGDLFHESVPEDWINRVFSVMTHPIGGRSHHTYIILTKRPERILQGQAERFAQWDNIWLGVTAENQQAADERLPVLLQIPAAVRFVSVEPMLGPVDMEPFLQYPPLHDNHKMTFGKNDWRGLDWVICGGESGPGARPTDPPWVQSLRDQCTSAEVPFFFKQWGEYCHPDQMPVDTYVEVDMVHNLAGHGGYNRPWKVGKKKAGWELDGMTWNEFPEGGKR